MIDFRIKPVERDGKEIFDTQDGLTIEMMANTDNELPVFEDALPNIYGQTLILLGTTMRGDLTYEPTYGIQMNNVISAGRVGVEGNIAKNNMITNISAMVTDLFEKNEDILALATMIESAGIIEPQMER